MAPDRSEATANYYMTQGGADLFTETKVARLAAKDRAKPQAKNYTMLERYRQQPLVDRLRHERDTAEKRGYARLAKAMDRADFERGEAKRVRGLAMARVETLDAQNKRLLAEIERLEARVRSLNALR